MSLSNLPRAMAKLLVVWLIADAYFGVKVSRWSSLAKYAAFATVVGALTNLTLRVTYGRRMGVQPTVRTIGGKRPESLR